MCRRGCLLGGLAGPIVSVTAMRECIWTMLSRAPCGGELESFTISIPCVKRVKGMVVPMDDA
jgi:hypothetical protein